jgi:hypothetical protein
MGVSLPTIIAHRGNAAEFPENTLEALQSAVDLGVRHVELDVQLSADRGSFSSSRRGLSPHERPRPIRRSTWPGPRFRGCR